MEEVSRNEQVEEIIYPSVIFKVGNGLYCASSKYIETLTQLPEHEPLPEAPPTVTGVFPYRGDFITMFDMRTAFGQESLANRFSSFCDILDQRKADHIRWVGELERCGQNDEELTLASDPHKCAFGKWYYSFNSENALINAQLRKIEEPHRLLHETTHDLELCRKKEKPDERERCINRILDLAKNKYMPQVLGLLDETKEIFRTALFNEMVIILRDARVGLVVDEILMVDHLLPEDENNGFGSLHSSPYVLGIRHSEKVDKVLLELNIPEILRSGIGADLSELATLQNEPAAAAQ